VNDCSDAVADPFIGLKYKFPMSRIGAAYVGAVVCSFSHIH
jgi:hypothetical protein